MFVLASAAAVSVTAALGFYAVDRAWRSASIRLAPQAMGKGSGAVGLLATGWILVTMATLLSAMILASIISEEGALALLAMLWAICGGLFVALQTRFKSTNHERLLPWQLQWNLLTHWVLVAISLLLAFLESSWGLQIYILSLGFLVNWLIDAYTRFIRIHSDWRGCTDPQREDDLAVRDNLFTGYYVLAVVTLTAVLLALLAAVSDRSFDALGSAGWNSATVVLALGIVFVICVSLMSQRIGRPIALWAWWLAVAVLASGTLAQGIQAFKWLPEGSAVAAVLLGTVLFFGAGESLLFNMAFLKRRRPSRFEWGACLAVSVVTAAGAMSVFLNAVGGQDAWGPAILSFVLFAATGIGLRFLLGKLLLDLPDSPASGYTPNSTGFNLRHDFVLYGAVVAGLALWVALGTATSFTSFQIPFITVAVFATIVGILHVISTPNIKRHGWDFARTELGEDGYLRLAKTVKHRLWIQDVSAVAMAWSAWVFLASLA